MMQELIKMIVNRVRQNFSDLGFFYFITSGKVQIDPKSQLREKSRKSPADTTNFKKTGCHGNTLMILKIHL